MTDEQTRAGIVRAAMPLGQAISLDALVEATGLARESIVKVLCDFKRDGMAMAVPTYVRVRDARPKRQAGRVGVSNGKTAKLREVMATVPGAYCEDLSLACGFPAFPLLHRMAQLGYCRKEEGENGLRYFLTDKPLPVAASDEERRAKAAEAKRQHRERRRAGQPIRKNRKYATPEERAEAKRVQVRESQRRYYAKVMAANSPRKATPKKPARSMEARIAVQVAAERRAPVVQEATKPVLPSSDAFIAANADKYEVLPRGAISQPKPTLTAKERQQIKGRAFA